MLYLYSVQLAHMLMLYLYSVQLAHMLMLYLYSVQLAHMLMLYLSVMMADIVVLTCYVMTHVCYVALDYLF